MAAATATAAASVAPAEPTKAPATLAQVEPTRTSAPLVQTEPTNTPVALAPTATLSPTETTAPTPTISFTATSAPTRTPPPTSTLVAMSAQASASTPRAQTDRDRRSTPHHHHRGGHRPGSRGRRGRAARCHPGNLKVRFAGGKTHITADKLGYGIIKMQNLDLVGSLAAQNGVLSLAVESISPRGLPPTSSRARSTRRWRASPRSGTWKKCARLTGGWSCGSDSGHEALIRITVVRQKKIRAVGARSPRPGRGDHTPTSPRHCLDIYS